MEDPNERKRRIRDRLRVTAVFAVLVMVIAFIVYFGMVALGRLPIPRWPQPDKTPSAPTATVEPTPTATVVPTPTATVEPTLAPTMEPSALWTDAKSEEIPPVTLQSPGQERWQYQISNAQLLLDEDYEPEELVEIESGQYVDVRIEAPLREMFAAVRAAGYGLYFCSGYRDYDTQSIIYWNHIYDYEAQGMSFEEADALTRLSVNPPGASEHQLGLTADVLEYAGQPMMSYIGGSGLMAWLENNCARYGFIIRYPEGKTDITGVDYEPWHLRYVGPAAAAYIMKNDLCLEEFLQLYIERKEVSAESPEQTQQIQTDDTVTKGKGKS